MIMVNTKVVLTLLIALLLFLSACRVQSGVPEPPQEQQQVLVSGFSTDLTNTLSGLRSRNVADSLEETERERLEESVSEVSASNEAVSDDVDSTLNIAVDSRNPALLDAALRLKRLYSGNTIEYYVGELSSQTSGNIDETFDDYVFTLNIEIDQAREIIEEIKRIAEESGNTLMLNHLISMEVHFNELYGDVDETTNELITAIGVVDHLDAAEFEDSNGNGIIDVEEFKEQLSVVYPEGAVGGIPVEIVENAIESGNTFTLDVDDDGVDDFSDSDVEIDESEFDLNDDGVVNEEDFDEYYENLGLDKNYAHGGFVDKYFEYKTSAEESYGGPDDTDNDGVYDYEDEDIDNDKILNADDDDKNGNDISDAYEYYEFERYVSTGIAGSDIEGIPHEFIEAMEEAESPEEFEKLRQSYFAAYQKDYADYLNDNPNVADEIAYSVINADPETAERYNKYLIDHSEFGFAAEAGYWVENNPDVLKDYPEYFVVPDVRAHMEGLRDAYDAYLSGGVSAMPEGLERDYLLAHPEDAETYRGSMEGIFEKYDSHEENFQVAYWSEDEMKNLFTSVYGEHASDSYDNYFDYSGEFDTSAYEAYVSSGYLGGPLPEDFSVPEGFEPPEGYESYFSSSSDGSVSYEGYSGGSDSGSWSEGSWSSDSGGSDSGSSGGDSGGYGGDSSGPTGYVVRYRYLK